MWPSVPSTIPGYSEGISEVNSFLKGHGFQLNSSGGEIKETPEQLLEQSSTLADKIFESTDYR